MLHVLKGWKHVVSIDQREQTLWHRVQGPELKTSRRGEKVRGAWSIICPSWLLTTENEQNLKWWRFRPQWNPAHFVFALCKHCLPSRDTVQGRSSHKNSNSGRLFQRSRWNGLHLGTLPWVSGWESANNHRTHGNRPLGATYNNTFSLESTFESSS